MLWPILSLFFFYMYLSLPLKTGNSSPYLWLYGNQSDKMIITEYGAGMKSSWKVKLSKSLLTPQCYKSSLVPEFACFLPEWYLVLSVSPIFSTIDFAESECLNPLKTPVLKPNH